MENDYELKGTYDSEQTPDERLRNLITPFFTLTDLIREKNTPGLSKEYLSKLEELTSRTASICAQNKDRIKDYLTDVPIFYEKYNSRDSE